MTGIIKPTLEKSCKKYIFDTKQKKILHKCMKVMSLHRFSAVVIEYKTKLKYKVK